MPALRPLKNAQFCSSSRKAKILTGGIHWVFWGLKFEPDAEVGQKRAFCKCLALPLISWCYLGIIISTWPKTLFFRSKIRNPTRSEACANHEIRHGVKLALNNDKNKNALMTKTSSFPPPWAWLVLIILSFDIRICWALTLHFVPDFGFRYLDFVWTWLFVQTLINILILLRLSPLNRKSERIPRSLLRG